MITDDLLSQPAFEANDELFLSSLREACQHHIENNDYFKFLWNKYHINPLDIESISDLSRIPTIMVDIFKHHKLISGKEKDIVLTLGSSGTSGQRSQIFLDQCSLDRVKQLAFNVHRDLGITSEKKYNYICFTYDPQVASDLGTAFTDELLTSFTEKAEVFYTFQFENGEFVFKEKETVEKLIEFSQSENGTRLLGFPAFLYEILVKYNIQLDLGKDSWVQTGGGWKSKADQEIPKEEFREFVSEHLGIPRENIRDLFGMVEHGIPYVDDANGRLRIPNYARVLIRDPKTFEVLPHGKKGLVQFISTYLTSFPSISLLTADWGRVQTDQSGTYLELAGRAGVSKNKGCALKALELMS